MNAVCALAESVLASWRSSKVPRAEIIVYGHTHKPLLELVDRTVTVMNPGGAGHPRFGIPPSVGVMELEAGIPPRARLVQLP